MKFNLIKCLEFIVLIIVLSFNSTYSLHDTSVTNTSLISKYLTKTQETVKYTINLVINSTAGIRRNIKSFFRKLFISDKPKRTVIRALDGPLIDKSESLISVPARVLKNGYKFEVHLVESNGYVLSVHRVPCARYSNRISNKTVLLQHGLLGSSADWLLSGPGKGLAYVLADAGYDVWMTNVRGNKFSREHLNYSTDSEAYWNFTWHDVAVQDLPTIIDFINQKKNNVSDLFFIGKSMGTTMMFVMLALRPEYNHLLKAGYAIAPLAYMSYFSKPFKMFSQILIDLADMDRKMGIFEFAPEEKIMRKLLRACLNVQIEDFVCDVMFFFISGLDGGKYDENKSLLFLRYLGKGTSWKTIVHFAQQVITDKFQVYDYGGYNTYEYLGDNNVTEYNLSAVSLPITLFWTNNTDMSSEHIIKRLSSELKNSTSVILSSRNVKFNFIDYTLAKNGSELLNDKILEHLSRAY